jgi:hypothetical protein
VWPGDMVLLTRSSEGVERLRSGSGGQVIIHVYGRYSVM